MSVQDRQIEQAIQHLNSAKRGHFRWTQRFLRLALLGGEPKVDLIAADAAQRCEFGHWLTHDAGLLGEIAPEVHQQLIDIHGQMHHAAREVSLGIHRQQVTPAALDEFERLQEQLIELISESRTQLLNLKNLHDPLTGLPQRRLLQDAFGKFRKRCQRDGKQPFLAVIDLDHFKSINDRFGHGVGDRALCHVVDTLSAVQREDEVLFRFGGEEFVQLLAARDGREAACAVRRGLERLRHAPLSLPDGGHLQMTLTAGLVAVGEQEDLDAAIARADAAMYQGKQDGRNRCVLASS
jgi:diguanylate cyclase (GGDEF)-like protein